MAAAHCPECGVSENGGTGCLARYHSFLALEYTDPAYGAVHHLTVLAYQLQHPSGISRSGWMHMRALFRDFLKTGVSPKEVLRRGRSKWQNGSREWRIRAGPRLALPQGFCWGRSIDSVDCSRADSYKREVTLWARQVLEDLERVTDEKCSPK